ncbi:MAG: lamin tail domain-containing protein [Haloferacaceae archaeon]
MAGDRSRGADVVPSSPLVGLRDWLLGSPFRLQLLVAAVVVLTATGVTTGALVLLGGVSLHGPPAGAASSPAGRPANRTATPPPATTTPSATPSATPTATPADAVDGYRPATVLGVTTGGVVSVRFDDGRVRRLPLAAVRVPDAAGDSPTAFDGVLTGSTGRACLGTHGARATGTLADRLVGASVGARVVPDGTAPGNVGLLVRNGGRVVNRDLVERGNASATTARYAAEMDDARANGRGLWACGTVEPGRRHGDLPATVDVTPPRAADTGGLRVVRIRPNPPDGAPLSDETITLENTGDRTVSLSGWTLGDERGTRRTLLALATPEDRRLQPGERLVVHTGAGPPTAGHLYLDHPNELWGDDGGVVRLVDRRRAPPRTVTVRYGDAVSTPSDDARATDLRPPSTP